MKIRKLNRLAVRAGITFAVAVAMAATAFGQYSEDYIVNVVQQQIRTRIINDMRGSGHEFNFDNNAVVQMGNARNLRRVAGSGRHRFNRAGWRVFNYEGQFNMGTGLVLSVDYQYSNDVEFPGNTSADLTWPGNVDDRVTITTRGRTAIARGRGFPRPDPTNVRYDFRNPLPSRFARVSVRKIEGRGSVNIIQQPSASNGWTAIAEISDPQRSDDRYVLEFDWGRDSGPPVNLPEFGRGKINWRGRVDDTVEIRIQGGRVTSREMNGGNVQGDDYNVREQLPREEVDVRVNRRDGRGSVRVTDQPAYRNSFTTTIEIRDPRPGSDYYSIEIDWDDVRPPSNRPEFGEGKINWRGRIDATVDIIIQGRRVTYRELNGRRVEDVDFNVSEELPRRDVDVRVSRRDGRGDVSVLQQPTSRNGYTAIIRVSDPRSGSDFYNLEIDWDNFFGGGESRSQMTWRGRVDATVRITIRRRDANARELYGVPVSVERAIFNQELPRRAVNVTANKREGRGDVRVIQQPNLFNGFTAVVEITDPRSGSDVYEFDLFW